MARIFPFAIVLAAGTASRFGATKQLAEYAGVALVKRTLRTAEAVCGGNSVLVTGNDWRAVADVCRPMRGFMIVNDDFAAGIGTSIRAGVACVAEVANAVLLLLADQPLVTADHLERMIDISRDSPDSIIASEYADTLGPPVIFPTSRFPELLTLGGDQGAKSVIEKHREQVVAIRFEPAAVDIDRPQDLENS
jgi:molybdenum cofactor cytidylyltransferase